MKYLLLAPAVLVIAIFAIVPIAGAIVGSLHHETAQEPSRFVGLENYARLAREPEAADSFRYTLFFVGWSVTLEIVLGLALALLLHQGKGILRASTLVPWALPTVVASMIWRYVFDDRYGIIPVSLADPSAAQIVIVLADVWKTTPFTALLLLAGLQAIPDDLYEAARIDGASAARRFFTITLPLLRPALLVALLFRTMDAFRVFDLVFVLTQGKEGTSVLQFFGYKALFGRQDYGLGAAVSCSVFAMVGIIAIFYVRALGARR